MRGVFEMKEARPVCPPLRSVAVQKGGYVLIPGRKGEVVWSGVLT